MVDHIGLSVLLMYLSQDLNHICHSMYHEAPYVTTLHNMKYFIIFSYRTSPIAIGKTHEINGQLYIELI